jgi:hypothetical protein
MAAAARAGPQAAAAGGHAPAARQGRVAMLSRAPQRLAGGSSAASWRRRRHQRWLAAAGDNESSSGSSSIRTTTTEPTGGRRPARQQQHQQQQEPQLSSSTSTETEPETENPLELLRRARDPQRRAALMQRATGTGGGWRAWAESYRPLAVELLLCRELGVGSSEAMMLAVGNPALAAAFPDPALSPDDDQDASDADDDPRLAPARRALRALRGAGLADADAWFAVSRRPSLLAHPPSLQRWLDLLSLYEARPADVVSFLTRAPDALLRPEQQQQQREADRAQASTTTTTTDHQTNDEPTFSEAQAVARYLTSELRLPRDELARRVLCARPALLARDVQRDLVPLHEFAERELGFSPTEWGRVVLACPELLAEATVARHLRPFLDFCREQLGAAPPQTAALLALSPRLPLGKPAAAAQAPDAPATPISHADSDGSLDACPAAGALAPRLRVLEELAGVGQPGSERLWQLTAAAAAAGARAGASGGSGLEWLAAPGAPEAQLRVLSRALGASREDLGRLAVACPALLSQRPDELARRVGWLALAAAPAEGGGEEGQRQPSSSSKAARRRAALALALAHPHVLVAPLRRLAAPRLAFALATERGDGAALTPAAAREAGRRAANAALEGEEEEQKDEQEVEAVAEAVSFARLPDLTALVAPNADDAAWVAGLRTLLPPPPPEAGAPSPSPPLPLPVAAASSPSSVFAATAPSRLASAYVAFRAEFDLGYAEAVADASTAELRKLGIVEGSGGRPAAR